MPVGPIHWWMTRDEFAEWMDPVQDRNESYANFDDMVKNPDVKWPVHTDPDTGLITVRIEVDCWCAHNGHACTCGP